MKKKLYALSGVLLIVLVITGLWASKAGGFTEGDQAIDQSTTRKLNGVSMKEMAQNADRIVIGTCTGTQSVWTDNNRRLITLATVKVEETLKGAETESVIVEVLGGHGGKGKFQFAMTYPGAATFGAAEKVALFLVPANEVTNTYAVMGSNAGKLSIVTDVDNKQVVTSVPMRVRAPRATGLTSGNSDFIELSAFKAMIEEYLR